MSRIERGTSNLSLDGIERLAAVFGISVGELGFSSQKGRRGRPVRLDDWRVKVDERNAIAAMLIF